MASCRSIPPSLALLVPVPDKYNTINNAPFKLLSNSNFLAKLAEGNVYVLPFET